MGLLWEIFKSLSNDNDKKKELEKDMNNHDLEKWQKDLVKKEEYDSSSFDEEDLEEDDYYSEDDK